MDYNGKKNIARNAIDRFERLIRQFIIEELKTHYNDEYWEKGIPEIIRKRISDQLVQKKKHEPKKNYKRTEEFTFKDYDSIIRYKNNWIQIFKGHFHEKTSLYPLERLRALRNELYHARRLDDKDFKKIEAYIDDFLKFIPNEFTNGDLQDLKWEREKFVDDFIAQFQVKRSALSSQPLSKHPKKENNADHDDQSDLPLISTKKILRVMSNEDWQPITYLILKLKIKDMMDARFLQLKMKELVRKKLVEEKIIKTKKHWKLK